MALGLLNVVPTEAAVERSFSAQSFLHSETRNQLTDKVVEGLVFIKMNWNLLFPELNSS